MKIWLRKLLVPRYELRDDCFFNNQYLIAWNEIEGWHVPNKAMKPLNLLARFMLAKWRWSLPRAATQIDIDRYMKNFRKVSELDMLPVHNEIVPRTKHKRTSANWYDHKSNVLEIKNRQ